MSPSAAATEMHHTLGGIGRRRQQQSVGNVRMLCHRHHVEETRKGKR